MLFAITWTVPGTHTEERERRLLTLFTNWRPPAGVEFKAFYDYADGDGGIAIVETASADLLLEAIAPFATFFEFKARPIVPTEKAAQIYLKAVAWRDSIE